MKILDTKSAAEAISHLVDPDHFKKQPPETHHTLDYLTQVCYHLKLEPNGANIAHVAQHLTAAGIQQHMRHDFPQWVEVSPVGGGGDLDELAEIVGSHRLHIDRRHKVTILFDSKEHVHEFAALHSKEWQLGEIE